MAVVDVLKYVLGLDTKDLQAGAKTAEATVNSMASKMVTSIGRVATAFGGMYAAHKALEMSKQLGEFALGVTQTAARTEELQIVLENVGRVSGYSTKYLAEQEKVIKGLGITTQASRMLLIRFMQSQLSVADATKIARAAQDLAVIAQMDSSQAAETLTYAIAAQRPILLRQFGIVTDLSEVFNKQAKILGKNAEELTENEKRMAFFNIVMEQAARVTGTYEAAMETAGKQARSIPRYSQEAANAIGNVFMPVFREMVKDVTEGFKDIEKAFTENEEAIKKWQDALIGAYKPISATFWLLKQTINSTIGYIQQLKLFTLDLVEVLVTQWAKASLIFYEGYWKPMREAYKGLGPFPTYGPPKPEDIEKVTEPLSKALYKQMMWKLDLDRKYEKITLGEYKNHLQEILTAYKLTEEQKAEIKKRIAEVEYEIEANLVKNYEAKLKEWNETYLQFIKDRTEQVKEIETNKYDWLYAHEKISTDQYLSFLEMRLAKFEEYSDEWIGIQQKIEDIKQGIIDKDLAHQEEMLDMMLVGYDSFFDSIINRNLNMTEALKLAQQDLVKSMLGYGADLLKQEIKNALLRKATEESVQKTKLAAIAAGSAKSIAWMAKEGAAAVASAAKFIYEAVAKIFSAHAKIPFVGVAIAGGLVATMMATIAGFKKFAEGGLVGGDSSAVDKIAALLTKGEFVMPRPAVQRIGVPALEHMRRTGR